MDNYNLLGAWIGADMTIDDRFAPVFKKEFSVNEKPEKAEIRICGLGLFELKINGSLPDDSVLNPAHTQYSQTVLYRTFDITEHIVEGKNTVTVELGNSFFNETVHTWKWDNASWRSAPKLIADITVNYSDGTLQTVSTDESWLVSLNSPTTENSIYYGETFDARNLDKMSFSHNAIKVSAPAGKLKEQNMPPIRRIASFKPKSIFRNENGSIIVTAPEMITGWAAIKFNEPENSEITVSYGERLNSNGQLILIGKGEGRDGNWYPLGYIQQDKFISNGKPFVFEPKFSYKGFRYIQIDNCSADLTEDDITIYRVVNDVKIYSEFTCSDEMINKLHKLMRNTLLNNFQGKPTDTPVWEKNGWLGDLNCGLKSIMYNFDIGTFLSSFIDTMEDCFNEYGGVPVFVPIVDWSKERSPVWNTIFVFAAQAVADFCGMNGYTESIYPALRSFALDYIDYFKEIGWVWGVRGLSDWVAPLGDENMPDDPNNSEGAEICGTAYVYAMLNSMATIAENLGKSEDAEEYKIAAKSIFNAFNAKFYNTEKGYYETSFWEQRGLRKKYRQTSNLLPLAFGLVPDEHRKAVVDNLINDITARDYHLDTGCVGTQFVLPVLFDCGYANIASKVLMQKTYPSWGFWIENGADSAWECWEKTTRSMNHYFLATYEEALYSHIAGIRNIKNGFKSFTIAPEFGCGLEFAKAEFDLANGKLKSEWHKNPDSGIIAEIIIPDGSEANIILSPSYNKTFTAGKYIFNISANGIVTQE